MVDFEFLASLFHKFDGLGAFRYEADNDSLVVDIGVHGDWQKQ